jgi:DNA-binding HxlR family transcriptional regulator
MRKLNSTNHINEKKITEKCPITATMLAIGGRWKVIIIWQLRQNKLRYSEIRKTIPHISEKMLTQQLKELADAGWILKKDFQEIPPRTEYSLTKLGRSFVPVLEHIYDWGVANKMAKV